MLPKSEGYARASWTDKKTILLRVAHKAGKRLWAEPGKSQETSSVSAGASRTFSWEYQGQASAASETPENQHGRDGEAYEPLGVTPDSIKSDRALKEGPSCLPGEGSL